VKNNPLRRIRMADIYDSLVAIVGKDHVSSAEEERYFYARDAGLMPAHKPDYVVVPKETEEVQKIVKMANEMKVPVVPMGGAMSLAGLVVPLKGGIVLDMKRMRNILRVNERARYAVVEGGTSYGLLKGYLEKEYPNLTLSMPDAPPATTIAANVAIHGQGYLSQQHGFNSDMVTGLEVVLPNGEICKIGSCAMSPDWFSKGPSLPDLSGLFLGWLGTTGVITKVGLKLYPKKKIRDVIIFVTDIAELVPDVVFRFTHTGVGENIGCLYDRDEFRENHLIPVYMSGDTLDEVEFKTRIVWGSVQDVIVRGDGGFMMPFPAEKAKMLEMPLRMISRSADLKEGGGFEYSGPIVLVEKYPALAGKAKEVAEKYKLRCSVMARVLDAGHSLMFGMGFPFNRVDPEMLNRIREGLHEWFAFALEQGAIPWKPTIDEQKMAMERMDPVTLRLMKMIKENLDPNGIMNPGNWEVK
jgi:glycolate oxidase